MLESNIIPSCLFSINGFINLNVMNINKKSFLIFLFAAGRDVCYSSKPVQMDR